MAVTQVLLISSHVPLENAVEQRYQNNIMLRMFYWILLTMILPRLCGCLCCRLNNNLGWHLGVRVKCQLKRNNMCPLRCQSYLHAACTYHMTAAVPFLKHHCFHPLAPLMETITPGTSTRFCCCLQRHSPWRPV